MIRRLIVCLSIVGTAVAGSALLAAPAAANEATAQAAAAKPMKLKKYMKKPVASSATRTVKKKNGEYTKASTKRRAARSAATPPAPEKTISPEAAQAMASYELARVRVVTPETTGSTNLLTDPTSTIVNVDMVEVVNAEEVNDIDRKADSPAAVSLDALSRDLAGSGGRDFAAIEPKAQNNARDSDTTDDTWLQRLLTMLGSAFAAVTALARTLLG